MTSAILCTLGYHRWGTMKVILDNAPNKALKTVVVCRKCGREKFQYIAIGKH